jgi:hypothetical protein
VEILSFEIYGKPGYIRFKLDQAWRLAFPQLDICAFVL